MSATNLIEQDIPLFREIYYKGSDFDKSVEIYTDEDCETPFDFTYHQGKILYKRVNEYRGALLSFDTENDTLYLTASGLVRRFRQLGIMPDLPIGEYQGDLRIRDLTNSGWTTIARFILDVRLTANFKG
jgi:hypothetical protein